jgi:hypothetical protein
MKIWVDINNKLIVLNYVQDILPAAVVGHSIPTNLSPET